MEAPKGFDIIVMFAQKTGRVLPDHFWQYYVEWCTAYKQGDNNKMNQLLRHSNASQYAVWIEDIQAVLAVNQEDLTTKKSQ